YNKVKLVSVIGEDFGDDNLDILKSKGIDVEGIEIVPRGKSFFWAGKYHNDMNSRDTLITELNVLADFDPKLPSSYQDCRYLLLGNLTPQVQIATLDRLHHKPRLVVLDTMNFWMDVALEDLKAVMKKVDVVTRNDAEARQLSGEYSLVKAARLISPMGSEHLLIEQGEPSAILGDEGHVLSAPDL